MEAIIADFHTLFFIQVMFTLNLFKALVLNFLTLKPSETEPIVYEEKRHLLFRF